MSPLIKNIFQTFMNWRVPVSRSTTSMSSEFHFYCPTKYLLSSFLRIDPLNLDRLSHLQNVFSKYDKQVIQFFQMCSLKTSALNFMLHQCSLSCLNVSWLMVNVIEL